MAPIKTFTLDHPQLGPLTGRLIDDQHADKQPVTNPVAHFRSIPYATIPGRFRQSTILDHIPDDFDSRPYREFTQYGAACPQVPQPTGKGNATGGFVPGEEPPIYDEQACLNLTISTPTEHFVDNKKPLPVMVYVHGGGLIEGTGHTSALHDTTKMTELAARENMDVVIVSIGYRLNWQGFIACYDLLEEAKENGEPPFNYGLRDQRNAFLWIQKHIAGFGGDPSNITAFGESGGAISLFLQTCSDVPLFRRVILQSNSPTLVDASWGLDEHDAYYHRLLSFLDITAPSPAERLRALRRVPVSRFIDFVRENRLIFMRPTLGPESGFFPTHPCSVSQGEMLANCSWLDEIMIGDSSGEGQVYASLLKDFTPNQFVARFRNALGDESARRVLDAYEIYKDMDEGLFWQNALVIMGDVVFSEPTHSTAIAVAQAGRQRLYRWQFCLQNPFPGSELSYSVGHHFVELMYQFMTLTARFPVHRNHFLRRQAEQMAQSWIRFANGLPPMEEAKPYELETGSIMICDMLHGWTVRTRGEDEASSQEDLWGPRRYRQWEILSEELLKSEVASDCQRMEGIRSQLLVML